MKINKGFTLVEMLVAVGLFTLISTISLGAILTIFDANRRSQTSKTVVDNLNFAIENMTRTVRFGSNYHCGTGGTLTTVQNCNTGGANDTLLAVNFNGATVVYRLNGTRLERSDNGGSSYVALTSSDVNIEWLRFYVLGSSNSDSVQPYVIAVIKGYVGNKPTLQSKFSIQTMMSQRKIDIAP